MNDHEHFEDIDQSLRPLVAQLQKRYPGVRIVEARYSRTHDGELRQRVRYQAALEVLRRVGLLTDDMLRHCRFNDRTLHADGITDLGDNFWICPKLDQASRPGCLDLTVWTGVHGEHSRKQFAVRQAARLLRRIAKCKRLGGPKASR